MALGNRNQRLNGLNPLAYIGDNAYQPPEFVTYNRAPTTNDNSNFELGTIWLNNGTNNPPLATDIWMLVSLNGGIAIWRQMSGGMGDIQTLTGNSGGAVGPDGAANINVVGDNTGITIVGNPGTFTLTASLVGGGIAAQSFPTGPGVSTVSGGTAVPTALGVLNVLGSHNVDTGAAVANTVTVFGTNAITLGDLVAIAADSGAMTATTGDVIITAGDLTLPNTNTAGNQGVIKFGGSRFISNFGTNNTFVGASTGNTTVTGSLNTAVGTSSTMISMTTGSVNNAFGAGALRAVTTGSQNNAFGNSLNNLTTGTQNTAVGYFTGDSLTTGSNNTFLGAASGVTANATGNSNIYIHHQGAVVESNVLRIGQSGEATLTLTKAFIDGIRGVITDVNDAIPVLIDSVGQLGTTSSSIRFKQNIEDMEAESDDVMKLRPVIFEYKDHPGIKQYGLIAEEVKEHMPRLVVHDEKGLPLSVKYHELPAILLNEIQKLHKRIEELERSQV